MHDGHLECVGIQDDAVDYDGGNGKQRKHPVILGMSSPKETDTLLAVSGRRQGGKGKSKNPSS